jgi:dienelactone hydrolase
MSSIWNIFYKRKICSDSIYAFGFCTFVVPMWKNLLISLLFTVLTSCSYLPEPPAEPEGVRIQEKRDYLLIEPLASAGVGATGLIIYPGGLVDPHAYISLGSAFALSGEGHKVFVVKMPANLAVLDMKAARSILKKQDEADWVIAGHSLGGAMACSMVEKEKELFSGLILMAAYPAGSVDLSTWNKPVLSISASEDLVVDRGKYEDGRSRLPPGTLYETIEGGNHAGFGQYGEQKGDGEATISRTEQQRRIVELMQGFYLEHGLD